MVFNDTEAPSSTKPPSIVEDFLVCPGLGASVSWWFLFIGVRQVLTYSMALVTQSLVIDYLALSSRLCLDWLGPVVTLLVVQSKGWPFILIFWALYDLILLSGDRDFAHHWGYWQDWVGLFNEDNPSGNVVSNEWNYTILINAIIIGCAVAVKRLVVGLFLGRQTFGTWAHSTVASFPFEIDFDTTLTHYLFPPKYFHCASPLWRSACSSYEEHGPDWGGGVACQAN